MIKIGKLLILLGLTSGFVACSRGFDEPVSQTGILKTTLSTKSQISYPETSDDIDLSQLKLPSSSDFKVDILAEDEVVQSFEKFSDLPQSLELQLGKYKLKSVYGDNAKSGWNSVYYVGENDFLLSMTQNQANVLVECKLLSSFAYAKFDSKFRAAFRDFNVEFSTEKTPDPLVFVDGEKRIASFTESEKLWIVVTGVLNSTGKKFKYGITHLEGVKAGDLNVFNFTVNDGTISANVTVDNGVNVVKKTIDLDPSWVDDRFTKVYSSFDTDKPILFVAGMPSTKSYDVVIATNVGLKNLFIHFDEQFAADLGGVDKVDMLNLTPEMKTLVDTKVGAVLKTTADGKGYRLSLSGCKDKLGLRNGAMTQYKFKIEAIDKMETSKISNMDAFVIEIKADKMNLGKVWNRFAYIPAPYVVGADVSTLFEVPFEYWIKEGNGEWASLGVRSDKNETYLSTLKPNTNYQTKVTFEEFIVSECAFQTLPEIKIENGDFEKNETFTYANRGNRVGAEFEGWISTNATTTMNRGNDQYYRSYPSVRLANGKSGSGALIQTVGYGASTVYQHWTDAIWRTDFNRTRDKAQAGKLIYVSENGVAFTTLPSKMSFYYSFDSKQSNSMIGRVEILSNDEVIGVGEFINNANGGLTKAEAAIKYKSNGFTQASGYTKKPTHTKIWFSSKSSTAATSDLVDNDGSVRSSHTAFQKTTVDVWDARFEGSTLVIDDVALVYPTNFNEYTFE